MQLFELDSTTYEVKVAPEALLLKPFKLIYARDRSKGKGKAIKELAYIYFMADIKSNYQYIDDLSERSAEVLKDLDLKAWSPDKKIKEAMDFYVERSTTINSTIYSAAVQSAQDVSAYLKNTKKHLDDGLDITKITGAIKAMPQIMADLKKAEKEIILELKESTGRKKGSKSFNTFEDGL